MVPTIKDVAQKAQVGVGTVSRVINHNPAVSKHTRRKVEQAIIELNYTPNPSARSLSLGKTWQIAVVLPNLTFSSYVERLRGVQQALNNTDYQPILYSVGTPAQRDDCFDTLSNQNHVDGLLAISLTPTEDQIKTFLGNDIPVVLIDARHEQLSHVYVDDVSGGEMATQHLVDLGHTKIAFISDRIESPFQPSAADRYQGYCRALQENAIPYRDEYFREGKLDRENAKEMAQGLLFSEDPPTAIFTSSDTQAIGVLDAAKEAATEVPQDLSVIGYDGIPESEFVNLTTISQPLNESGYRGANLLLRNLEASSSVPQSEQLPVTVLMRGSTAPPRK